MYRISSLDCFLLEEKKPEVPYVVPVHVEDESVERDRVVGIARQDLADDRLSGIGPVPRPPRAEGGARWHGNGTGDHGVVGKGLKDRVK